MKTKLKWSFNSANVVRYCNISFHTRVIHFIWITSSLSYWFYNFIFVVLFELLAYNAASNEKNTACFVIPISYCYKNDF